MSEKLEIFYIRHADTSGAAPEGRDKCDVGLSALGEEQLKLLSGRFRGAEFDAVLSSPLVRAVKTAAAVASALKNNAKIELMPELCEKGTPYGCEFLGEEELKRYYPFVFYSEDRFYGGENGFFSSETDAETTERAKAVVKYLKERFHYGQKIAVISHGSFGNAFIPAATGFDEGDFILSVNNTSVTKIKYTSDGNSRLSFCNDLSHLRPLSPDYEFTV